MIRLYLQRTLPLIMRFGHAGPHAELLLRYYWDTIAECVPPETILAIMRRSGFVAVDHQVWVGILSEYVGAKPQP